MMCYVEKKTIHVFVFVLKRGKSAETSFNIYWRRNMSSKRTYYMNQNRFIQLRMLKSMVMISSFLFWHYSMQ